MDRRQVRRTLLATTRHEHDLGILSGDLAGRIAELVAMADDQAVTSIREISKRLDKLAFLEVLLLVDCRAELFLDHEQAVVSRLVPAAVRNGTGGKKRNFEVAGSDRGLRGSG